MRMNQFSEEWREGCCRQRPAGPKGLSENQGWQVLGSNCQCDEYREEEGGGDGEDGRSLDFNWQWKLQKNFEQESDLNGGHVKKMALAPVWRVD